MTTPLDAAMTRLSELRAEAAELETFIRVYYRLYPQHKLASLLPDGPRNTSVDKSVHKLVDKPVHDYASREPDTFKNGDDGFVPAKGPAKLANAREIFGDIFAQLIADANRPLTRGEMLERIEAMPNAPPLNSEDNSKYLGTLLWRNRDRFRNLPGHGYWLKNEPYPPASYDPALDTEGEAILDSEAGIIEPPDLPTELTVELRSEYHRAVKAVIEGRAAGRDPGDYVDAESRVMQIQDRFPEIMVNGRSAI